MRGQFGILLMQMIDEVEESAIRALVNGNATTFDIYRDRVGYLRALRDVKDMFGAAEKKMTGDDRPAKQKRD